MSPHATVELRGSAAAAPRADEVLTPEAVAFVSRLHERFGARRQELLDARAERRERIAAGELPDFLPETRDVREGEWTIDPVPAGLRDRRVEITGPTDRKMVINALNSGARMFMADFEDANAPTWANMVEGQANLTDAIERTIELETPDKTYRLNNEVATLLVRPRGWHLPERHLEFAGEPASASLFDFGLYAFRNARRLLDRGVGPWFYLPKLESHVEARLWNDVFTFAEDELGLARGSIRATVLIEHVLAAFEMDEILWELREHAAGLNAGRWDYMFSVIKTFRERPAFVLPDRNAVAMTAPFMRAYTELLVRTCHRRGAHAMGGMAAFIPSRRDAELNERALAKVREDKQREAGDGFDGTWVAHPDLVPVALAEFEHENQLGRLREEVEVSAEGLLDVAATPGEATEEGLRNDVAVALRYLTAWLAGTGAVAIFNLMEDAATAEIARSQVWQWVRHGRFRREDVERVIGEEAERFRAELGEGEWRVDEAREIFEQVALGERFVEFLTLPAYDHLERG
ncbi:MAG TPA: malate synthase A [Gaiellaceae bacterium]|nr:malate synthase A [Gaiellaceae bacterium]